MCGYVNKNLNHILTKCLNEARTTLWGLAARLWLYNTNKWPKIRLGKVLKCSLIKSKQVASENENNEQTKRKHKSKVHLLKILLSKIAYLI